MKNRALFFLVLSLSFFACQEQEDSVVPTEPEPESLLWKNILTELSENRQDLYNSGVQGNSLFVVGKNSRTEVFADGTAGETELWSTTRTLERRNAVSPHFLTSSHTWDEEQALFIYHYSTTLAENYFFLRFPDHPDLPGSLFVNFSGFNFGQEDAAISDANIVLLPLRSKTHPDRPALAQFTLKDPGESIIPMVTMDTASFREILLPAGYPNPLFLRIQALADGFFVSTGERSYHIRPDGSFQEIYDQPVLDFFMFQEDLYGYLGQSLIRSTDVGATWTEISTDWNPDLLRRFFTVEDQLFFYTGNRIFRVESQDFTATRIHEEQLTDRPIRSVTTFADHLYFATNQGLFRVSTDDFLTNN